MNRDRVVIAPSSPEPAVRSSVMRRALRRGFRSFVSSDSANETGAGEVTLWRRTGAELSPVTGREAAVPIVEVRDAVDLERAAAAGGEARAVAVRWTGERVVPLENLLAAGHGRFAVWVIVEQLRDVPAMLGALERGADRLVVEVHDEAELDRLESLLEDLGGPPIAWELVTVRRVGPAGIGDRVIVDTTSLLQPAEGLLVGSAAAFLLHVASEAEGSQFTRPRPFRVNAGAAHSYTLLADGTTRYLAELAAGDSVLIADPHGSSRVVRVGRIKIERRPLTLVEVERDHLVRTLFLQEAETVRLSGESARIPVTALAAGVRVYGAPFAPARHMGATVDETIEER